MPLSPEQNLLAYYQYPRNHDFVSVSSPRSPGFRTLPVETDMDLTYREKFTKMEVPDAYTRLILDVLRGEQATFVRSDELEAAWAIFTPLLHKIEEEKIKPEPYAFGSRGPESADEMMQKYYVRSKNYVWKGRQYGSLSMEDTTSEGPRSGL